MINYTDFDFGWGTWMQIKGAPYPSVLPMDPQALWHSSAANGHLEDVHGQSTTWKQTKTHPDNAETQTARGSMSFSVRTPSTDRSLSTIRAAVRPADWSSLLASKRVCSGEHVAVGLFAEMLPTLANNKQAILAWDNKYSLTCPKMTETNQNTKYIMPQDNIGQGHCQHLLDKSNINKHKNHKNIWNKWASKSCRLCFILFPWFSSKCPNDRSCRNAVDRCKSWRPYPLDAPYTLHLSSYCVWNHQWTNTDPWTQNLE